MKLLLVADLHYALPQWDWLAAEAPAFDVVAVAGDLLDLGSRVPREAQAMVVGRYLQRISGERPVLVSSGNHDLCGESHDAGWLAALDFDGLHPDGSGLGIGGWYFSVLGWWETREARQRVEAQLAAQQPEAAGKRWCWVHHSPPAGFRTAWSGHGDFGDSHLPRWIERYRPELVLGGHVHRAPFVARGSWIDSVGRCRTINGGRQPGRVPTMTVIDLAGGRVVWASADEAGQALLQGPLVTEPFDGTPM